jgi:hypothetical protein
LALAYDFFTPFAAKGCYAKSTWLGETRGKAGFWFAHQDDTLVPSI